MGMSHPDPSEVSLSCNTWGEPVALPGTPTTTMASMAGYDRHAAPGNQFENDADGFPGCISFSPWVMRLLYG